MHMKFILQYSCKLYLYSVITEFHNTIQFKKIDFLFNNVIRRPDDLLDRLAVSLPNFFAIQTDTSESADRRPVFMSVV